MDIKKFYNALEETIKLKNEILSSRENNQCKIITKTDIISDYSNYTLFYNLEKLYTAAFYEKFSE